MKLEYQWLSFLNSWYGAWSMLSTSSGLVRIWWMISWGLRYQSWYLVVIHSGVGLFSGRRPLYLTVYDFHGTHPSLMALIVEWKLWWSAIGGESWWGISASLNPVQDTKGVQLLLDQEDGGVGGVSGGRNSPSLWQGLSCIGGHKWLIIWGEKNLTYHKVLGGRLNEIFHDAPQCGGVICGWKYAL